MNLKNKYAINLDPISNILLKLILIQFHNLDLQKIFEKIDTKKFNDWLKKFCNINKCDLFSLKDIIACSDIACVLIFPPYINLFLKNRNKSVALSSQTLNRLLNTKFDFKIKKIKPSSKKHVIIGKKYKKYDCNTKHLISFMMNINNQIGISSKKESARKIRNIIKGGDYYENYEVVHILCEWLIYNLEKSKLAISTIKLYFSGFYKDLIYLMVSNNIILNDCSELEIETIVEELFINRVNYIKSLKKDNNSNSDELVANKIKNFFNWYNQAYNKKFSHEIYELLEYNTKNKKVRNSVITPIEFEKMFERLSAIEFDFKDEILSILILAFFAGLRKSEILQLKLNHLLFDVEPYILVKSSKTESGIRRILIHYLIPGKYLKFLEKFLKNQKTKKESNDYLFYRFDEELLEIKYVLDRLINILKENLNDKNFVFHSFRHSFVSFLYLRIYLALYDDFEKFIKIEFGNDMIGFDMFDKEKILELFGIHDNLKLCNDILWQLSVLVGHLSPQTTIETYLHTIDLFVKYRFWKYDIRLFGKFSAQQVLNLIPTLNSRRAISKKGWKSREGINLQEINSYLDKVILKC